MSPLSQISYNKQRALPPPIKTSSHQGTLGAYSSSNGENTPPKSDMSPTSSPSFMASTKSSRSAKMEPPSKLPRRAATPSSTSSTSRMNWVNTAARKIRRPSLGRKQKDEDVPLPTKPLPERNGSRPSVSADAANRTAYAFKYSMNKPLPSGPPREKPLPSPPVLTVVSKNSAEQASRTLIDASEKPLRISPGTLEEREWPSLSPEPSYNDLRAIESTSMSQFPSSNDELRSTISMQTLESRPSQSTIGRTPATHRFNGSTFSGKGGNASLASFTTIDNESTTSVTTTDEIKEPRPLRRRRNFPETRLTDGTKLESRIPRAAPGTPNKKSKEDGATNSRLPTFSGTHTVPRKPMPPALPVSSSQIGPETETLPKTRTSSRASRSNIPHKPSSLPSLRKSSSASFRSNTAAMNNVQPRIPASIQDSPDENIQDKSKPSSSETRKTQDSVASTIKSSNSSGLQLRGMRTNMRKSISHEPMSMASTLPRHDASQDLLHLLPSPIKSSPSATLTIETDTNKSRLETSDRASESSNSPLVPSFFRSSWIDSQQQSDTTSTSVSRDASIRSEASVVPASDASTRKVSSQASKASKIPSPPKRKIAPRKPLVSDAQDVADSGSEDTTCITPQPEFSSERLRLEARANALSMLEGRIPSPIRDGGSPFRSQRSTSPHTNVLMKRYGTNEYCDALAFDGTAPTMDTPTVPEDQQTTLSESRAPTTVAPSTVYKERSHHNQPLEAPVTSIKLQKHQTTDRKPSVASSNGTVKRNKPVPAVPAKITVTNHSVRPTNNVYYHGYSPRFPSMASSSYSHNDLRDSQIYNIPRMASSVKLPQSNTSAKSPSRLREKMSKVRNLFHKREHRHGAKLSCSASIKSKPGNDRRVTVTSGGSPLPTAPGNPHPIRSRSKTVDSVRASPSPTQRLKDLSDSIRASTTGYDTSPNRTTKHMLSMMLESAISSPDITVRQRALSLAHGVHAAVINCKNAEIANETAQQAAREAKDSLDHTHKAIRLISSVLEKSGILTDISLLSDRLSKSGR